MRWRKQKEEQSVEPTTIDTATQEMAVAVKHIRSLDSEVHSAFEEWRQVQARCLEEGIVVELQMSDYLSAAFTAWHEHKNGGEGTTTVIPLPGWEAKS